MPNKKLLLYEVLGFIFTAVVGTFLHFAFQASGGNRIVAFISPINESVWEHLKLLFFPYFFYTLAEYLYIGKKYNNFLYIKALSVVAGLLFIPVVFYIYSALLGKNMTAIDVAIFFAACFLSYLLSYFQLKNNQYSNMYLNAYGIAVFVLITMLFLLFTVSPPDLPLFISY